MINVAKFKQKFFLQCRKLFSFSVKQHEMHLEYQGLDTYEFSTKFVGPDKSLLIMFEFSLHPWIILEKTVKPRESIGLRRLCERFFPGHPIIERLSIPPKRKDDISILPLYASFLEEHWDEIFELQWVKRR